MANLAKLEFVALDISGKNYLSWVLDAEIHLQASNLGNTIKEGNTASQQDRAKAMIFLRHHVHEGLKDEYLTVKDPLELWKALAERYAHQKDVMLPRARFEWSNLRLQDFKTVKEYNSALFKISSMLRLCGEQITEDMLLEKTFSTFHVSNMLLQQQYQERGFKKYSELISCLLVAEQNNELLMRNHQSRPTGSQPFPEANASNFSRNGNRRGRRHGDWYNHGRSHGRKRGRGRHNGRGHKGYNQNLGPRNIAKFNKGNGQASKVPRNNDNNCHRCGSSNHWAKTCRTLKHLVDLDQASLERKNVEINHVDHSDPWESSGPLDITSLDVSDFFANNGSHVDDMIGGGVPNIN